MPDDPMYLPVFCGATLRKPEEIPKGYQRDDEGDNISAKNPNYCELTSLYWAWKNLPPEVEAIGLCHYRRHFSAKGLLGYKLAGKWESILTTPQAEKVLENADVALPNKRWYYIETIWNQYVHAHHQAELELTRDYVRKQSDMYAAAWDKVMSARSVHLFNMAIMRRDVLNQYLPWVFDVLGHVEEKLDISGYDAFEARVFGRISERLLDVWLMTNGVKVAGVREMHMEKQDWIAKVGNLIQRKQQVGVIA
jgi:hypothetical protein